MRRYESVSLVSSLIIAEAHKQYSHQRMNIPSHTFSWYSPSVLFFSLLFYSSLIVVARFHTRMIRSTYAFSAGRAVLETTTVRRSQNRCRCTNWKLSVLFTWFCRYIQEHCTVKTSQDEHPSFMISRVGTSSFVDFVFWVKSSQVKWIAILRLITHRSV